ncbi:MAG: right-handed parallel beta-helix repeat-containing protein [Lentisphaeraceae bacterium]|nr:right-handed parallel beta-helix repeat-containing protein [Lentisphaeraceae bacterium]
MKLVIKISLFLWVSISGLSLIAAEKLDWMQEGAQDEGAQLQYDKESQMSVPVIITKIPKTTANIKNYTKKYTLELNKFGISNKGENAVQTSKGINEALQHAKKMGKNYIIFPKGTYLISETDPVVFDHKDTIVDLNQSTIQINTNGLKKYSIVKIEHGAENFRLTNGTIRGDKDTHDKTAKGEWGHVLEVEGGRNLEIDHLTLTNGWGDGVVTQINGGSENRRKWHPHYNVDLVNLEQGAFAEKTGKKITSSEKTRTIKPYDIKAIESEFEFGYVFGYQGYVSIKSRIYQVYFYDKDMNFISERKCLQWKKYKAPKKAVFAHLEFNQPEVEGAKGQAFVGSFCNMHYSLDVHFHNNNVIGNRRNGMSYCGGQRWIIEDNIFQKNGGTAPGFGVDYEDGWNMMQDVVFRNNKFKDNERGDLVTCSGSELIFEGNEFEKAVAFWDATENYVFRNNRIVGNVMSTGSRPRMIGGSVSFKTRTGNVSIHDNHIENAQLDVTIVSKSSNYDNILVPVIKNTRIKNLYRAFGSHLSLEGCEITDSSFQARPTLKYLKFKNCVFKEASIHYWEGEEPVEFIIDKCRGAIKEIGKGLPRRNKK